MLELSPRQLAHRQLAPRQLEVLAFIRRFTLAHGFPPTRGEIAQGLKLKNRQGIDQHLRALESKGAIELLPGIARGIRLRAPASAGTTRPALVGSTAAAAGLPSPDHVGGKTASRKANPAAAAPAGLPLLGRIAAGSPILATGNIEDHLAVDPDLFRPRADFLLRVRGDSMKEADILDRDLLAVHRTTQVRNGQIVVARLAARPGDEATVKYYRRKGPLVRLEPANPACSPIEIDLREQEIAIEGLAVGVVRTALRAR